MHGSAEFFDLATSINEGDLVVALFSVLGYFHCAIW